MRTFDREHPELADVQDYWEDPETLDLDRFHRNWLLGLAAGVEAVRPIRRPEQIKALHEIARRELLPHGALYPSRVPWLTARVLLGLTAAGYSVDTSQVVSYASRWLRELAPRGPSQPRGGWLSGTGQWNSAGTTSAMCATALIDSGVGLSNPIFSGLPGFFLSELERTPTPNNEIDVMLMLEALRHLDEWGEPCEQRLAEILLWSNNKQIWDQANIDPNEYKEESSKIPMVACSLLDLTWVRIQDKIPEFLSSFNPIIANTVQSEAITAQLGNVQSSILSDLHVLSETLTKRKERLAGVTDFTIHSARMRHTPIFDEIKTISENLADCERYIARIKSKPELTRDELDKLAVWLEEVRNKSP